MYMMGQIIYYAKTEKQIFNVFSGRYLTNVVIRILHNQRRLVVTKQNIICLLNTEQRRQTTLGVKLILCV